MSVTAASEPSDLLTIGGLDHAQLEHLLTVATAMKISPLGWRERHAGQVLACFFSKPSTRTRVSLEAAAARLGMLPVMLRPDELQLGRGEPISDTGRVLSSYVDAIAIRTFAQSDVEELAAAASVPVINALTDEHHPCQALADLLTLNERFGRLAGLKLAYLGDGNNVAHSLLEACALMGVDIAVATPDGYRPDKRVVDGAAEVAERHGSRVELPSDPREAVAEAHSVYTDVWVSMGEEAEQAARLTALEPYRVDNKLMRCARRDAVFMHCLPAHRGQEVAAEVINGPHSVVFEQAANRLPTEQAAIHSLIDGHWA